MITQTGRGCTIRKRRYYAFVLSSASSVIATRRTILANYSYRRPGESGRPIFRYVAVGLLSALALLFATRSGPPPASAAPSDTITLTSPNNTVIAESDDYATQVLADPWDMANPEDVDYVDHMVNIAISNGIWSATSTNATPGIFFQYEQPPGALTYTNEANGENFPISHARFSHFRMRMYSSVADQMLAYWYRSGNYAPVGNSNITPIQAGWHIYDIDLNATGAGGTGNWNTGSWNQFLLRPLFGMGHTGANIQIDWARLVPATGPTATISWSASGSSPVSLISTRTPTQATASRRPSPRGSVHLAGIIAGIPVGSPPADTMCAPLWVPLPPTADF